jgi:hypothetical protein
MAKEPGNAEATVLPFPTKPTDPNTAAVPHGPGVAQGGAGAPPNTTATPGGGQKSNSGAPAPQTPAPAGGGTPAGTSGDPNLSGTENTLLGELSGSQRDAFSAVETLFASYGLASLAPDILTYVQQGYGGDTISLLLQNTDAYKQRFAGNAVRQKNGYAVLNPGEYLALEAQYKQISQSYGLPQGFYDNPQDFVNLIGNDISANEYQDRAQQAYTFTSGADQASMQAIQQFYGLGQSDVAAYFLDPSKAQSLIDKQAAAATIGALAIRNNVQGLQVGQAEQFVNQGVTGSQAQSGMQRLGMIEPDILAGAQRAGVQYNSQDALNDFVGGLASEQRKRLQISQNEESMFQPEGGVSTGHPFVGSF